MLLFHRLHAGSAGYGLFQDNRQIHACAVRRQNVYNFLGTCQGFTIDFEWPLGFYVYAGIACSLSLSRIFLYTSTFDFFSLKGMLSDAELLLYILVQSSIFIILSDSDILKSIRIKINRNKMMENK